MGSVGFLSVCCMVGLSSLVQKPEQCVELRKMTGLRQFGPQARLRRLNAAIALINLD